MLGFRTTVIDSFGMQNYINLYPNCLSFLLFLKSSVPHFQYSGTRSIVASCTGNRFMRTLCLRLIRGFQFCKYVCDSLFYATFFQSFNPLLLFFFYFSSVLPSSVFSLFLNRMSVNTLAMIHSFFCVLIVHIHNTLSLWDNLFVYARSVCRSHPQSLSALDNFCSL